MITFSLIIPVYDRPDEVDELLESLSKQTYTAFDIIVVEDGSVESCENIVDKYSKVLNIRYFYIKNHGPGGARNYGVQHSTSEYIIVLDSDCLVPPSYLENVNKSLQETEAVAFGGADKAHPSFTTIQKAINYSMTSFFTTGGIRGSKGAMDKFYPRSFNMGIRRDVYLALSGFSDMRYGEDIDFSIRLFKGGYKCCYFDDAWVYHKRRTDLLQFFKQVNHSGKARIVLYQKHPESLKIVHLLPAMFTIGLVLLLIIAIAFPIVLLLLLLYILILFIDSLIKNKNIIVAFVSVPAAFVQLTAYGTGFITNIWNKYILHKSLRLF